MVSSSTENVVAEFESIVPSLARRLMKKFNVTETTYDDLISCGYVALVEAAGKHATSNSESFKNYISLRVRGAMIDHLRASSILSGKSNRFVKALSAIQLMREEDLLEDPLFTENDKEPADNLAHIIDIAAKGAIAFRLSMDEADSDLKNVTDNQPTVEERMCEHEHNVALREIVKKLPEKERIVIESYYFEDKNFIEISQEHEGMNKSWVSRLHVRALNNLKNLIYENSQ